MTYVALAIYYTLMQITNPGKNNMFDLLAHLYFL